jgi:transcription elongation factor Elf1
MTMDSPKNRMDVPRRGQNPIIEAPPVVLPKKVLSCTCPGCGRRTQPVVRETEPERDMAYVRCQYCGANIAYYMANADNKVPRVRLVRRGEKT